MGALLLSEAMQAPMAWLQPERNSPCLHRMHYMMKGVHPMEQVSKPHSDCKNVFKHGRPPTKEEYTRLWIDLINQIERLKACK